MFYKDSRGIFAPGISFSVRIILGASDPPWNFKKLALYKSSAWECEQFWRVFALLEVLWQN
jgi:hypothetical protein